MTQNEHVYVICCRPEVAGDFISGENVKTIEGYAVLNSEVASFSSFRDIETRSPPIGGEAKRHGNRCRAGRYECPCKIW